MKYIDYKEHKKQGSFLFPVAFYHETPHSPRYLMQHHWHTQFEIIRILSGSMQLSINDHTYLCNEGDVAFIMDGFLHSGIPDNCIYECVVFDLNFLIKDNQACTRTLLDIIDHKILINPVLTKENHQILPIARSLCHTLASRKNGYEFLTLGYLFQLLGVIISEHLYQEAYKIQMPSNRLDSMKKVLAYISENYANNITLDQLAKIAGMNSKYFCRYFKGMTERTPIDYLNYYRIECACELLLTQNLSIKETAISCGFNDESYFIKTFHKYKGITPKQYMFMPF